ncbi:ubiquinol oxidase subunit II [Phenylobacterium sp. LjRoot219]|uniref:ubiquinol oxidase subunit II n=1 Tax=Phenylobacterium sp. LjRoot219 TaxID=3342283 RepID=UPI003ECFDCB9
MRLRPLSLVPLLLGLSACSFVVLDPAGDVAAQQRDLLVVSTLLMLLIIVPVMALTVFFAWRYRASNKSARYEPEWDHSTHLELVIWAAPLLIIICLGALTWAGTHLLDPYRPLARIKPGHDAAASAEPLQVNVVALDWKWLFIYPQYGVATVNELAAPVDRPIRFHITASSVMNSFYIPALAGQVYAMPGMETNLHGVINHAGVYQGFSANYSGDGFSNMRFAFHGLDQAGFDRWIAQAREGRTLDRARYLELERPSEKVPVMRFGQVDAGLWQAIVGLCVEPGKMCMGEMMAIDRRGGLGLKAVHNTAPLAYDKHARRGSAVFGVDDAFVLALCRPQDAPPKAGKAAEDRAPAFSAPTLGAGLSRISALERFDLGALAPAAAPNS